MIKVKAHIKLFKGNNKRKTPFISGYRPMFSFIKETKTSGHIQLINQLQFKPGDDGIVEITFINEKFLGEDFAIGKEFKFYEAKESLGEGKVLELL